MIRIGRTRVMFCTTTEAAEALRISKRTFERHAKRLGIKGRRHRSFPRKRFYSYDDIMRVAELTIPPPERYRRSLDKQMRAMKEAEATAQRLGKYKPEK